MEDGGADGGSTVVGGVVEAKRNVAEKCAGFATTSEGRHDERRLSVSRPWVKGLKGALAAVEANYERTSAQALQAKEEMLLCGH